MIEPFHDINPLLTKPYLLIIFAFLLDLAIGDPLWLPHPVRTMGWLIKKAEIFLRSPIILMKPGSEAKRKTEKLAGSLLVLFVCSITFSLFYIINMVLTDLQYCSSAPYLPLILMVFLIATTISTKGLLQAGRFILKALKDNNIETARNNLSQIVGRDTYSLGRKGILRATIESLAENTSDGIIAPLFYFAIGGLPLAMTYKAVNTMDSMVGYKNETYNYFGWAAARLDDIANYIPARITGILIVFAAGILGIRDWGFGIGKEKTAPQPLNPNPRVSLKIMLRDGRKHPSPNSGIPEAAMAGSLGISLGGPSTYANILIRKPFIGDEKQSSSDINNMDDIYLKASERAFTMVRIASFLGLIVSLGILYIRISL